MAEVVEIDEIRKTDESPNKICFGITVLVKNYYIDYSISQQVIIELGSLAMCVCRCVSMCA